MMLYVNKYIEYACTPSLQFRAASARRAGRVRAGGVPRPALHPHPLAPRAPQPQEGLAHEAGPHQGVAEALVRAAGLGPHVLQGSGLGEQRHHGRDHRPWPRSEGMQLDGEKKDLNT